MKRLLKVVNYCTISRAVEMNLMGDNIVTRDIEEINGSLETVYKIHFDSGKFTLEQLLDSIMIGPNATPFITKQAIEALLTKNSIMGVPVIISGVPLDTHR